ncbi:sjogren s syndrome nuclear autoantigen 1 [Trypanosoma cruzi cruzi]|uniref:Putative sjogren s syndrome nuclear autoantigen 1 n=1 Tax=Trypanosoma cruzi TaxID=5693 RepID=A0A2V2UJS1_TRYCR|nr:putative 13 kDa deflagellation-inducible protein [Trypanosoma cruzi]PBJ70258.1 sjogren s syndrome nuclear autoantigen 1 [Trypanosoma cruzi cruzi]PBJ81138.1 sjogren s syndrome nuclear autoantigen 1 [Trypanosoma cruzi cruzi]PWU84445.1 putative sjogren s syndrome nuclear autoantigen 1 [Trypanosoma cruzi]PWV01507.1 putative sjogren s syndrome nuclear autoantigen 1 [Trypanosoma cruzi]
MASLGSDVQATSNELVSAIEELKERRTEIERSIRCDEEERNRVLAELKALNARLTTIEESLRQKIGAKSVLDKVIHETSEGFRGIVEASRKLLSNVREESSGLPRHDGL